MAVSVPQQISQVTSGLGYWTNQGVALLDPTLCLCRYDPHEDPPSFSYPSLLGSPETRTTMSQETMRGYYIATAFDPPRGFYWTSRLVPAMFLRDDYVQQRPPPPDRPPPWGFSDMKKIHRNFPNDPCEKTAVPKFVSPTTFFSFFLTFSSCVKS